MPLSNVRGLLGVSLGLMLLVADASSTPAFTPTPDLDRARAAVAGRLGGSRASFEASFGAPIAEDSVNGSRYDVADLGLLLVSYRQTDATPLPDDVASVVILRAPRPESVSATAPDPADWSLDEARDSAEEFLPRDVTLGEPIGDSRANRLALECASPALADLSPAARSGSVAGECTVSLLTPSPTTVSFITLALGDASATSADPDPCAGMAEWGAATSERLTTANEALTTVGALAEDDPAAVTRLDEIAGSFSTLATEQEDAPVPPVAAAANAALVVALQAYADAIAAAARGLERGDQAILAEAAIAVEAARDDYAAADALIIAAIAGCDPRSQREA